MVNFWVHSSRLTVHTWIAITAEASSVNSRFYPPTVTIHHLTNYLCILDCFTFDIFKNKLNAVLQVNKNH